MNEKRNVIKIAGIVLLCIFALLWLCRRKNVDTPNSRESVEAAIQQIDTAGELHNSNARKIEELRQNNLRIRELEQEALDIVRECREFHERIGAKTKNGDKGH